MSLQTLPLFTFPMDDIPGYLYMIPCLGEGVPSDLCLNSAFSAPMTCIAPDGNSASFFSDLEDEIMSRQISGPAMAMELGMIDLISDSIFSLMAVLSWHNCCPFIKMSAINGSSDLIWKAEHGSFLWTSSITMFPNGRICS